MNLQMEYFLTADESTLGTLNNYSSRQSKDLRDCSVHIIRF